MGFFDQNNTTLETVWFAVLAVGSAFCFPFGVRLARRFPQIVAVKFVPVLCLLLAYENIVLSLSNLLSDDALLVRIGRTTRAAVIPVFLVVMFEVAYAVHKRRSVKFCGIVFDQGHRRSVEPCSWFLRNFVRIVAVVLFVLGILVNYNAIVGNDEKAGGTGLVDTEDASAHLLLALLPTTCMAVIALYIAIYMWKYGNDASIVVQSTVCNGWISLFLGSLALLGGQVPPESVFGIANESGQVLLLLSLISIGREIGKEIQAADDFSSFLEKENELEGERGVPSSVFSTAATAVEAKKSSGAFSSGARGAAVTGELALVGAAVEAAAADTADTADESGLSQQREMVVVDLEADGEKVEIQEKRQHDKGNHDGGCLVDVERGAGGDELCHNFDDVLSTRDRRPSRSSLTGLFSSAKRGGSMLHNRSDGFADLEDNGEEAHVERVGDIRILPLRGEEGGPGGDDLSRGGSDRRSSNGNRRRANGPFPPVSSVLGDPADRVGGDGAGTTAEGKHDVGIRLSDGVDVV